MKLTLPYPPSVNTYWGFRGSRRFLTKKAVEFKKAVAAEVSGGFVTDRLLVSVQLFPPDRRIRDIDNVVKPLLDALVQAGAMSDDSQIDYLVVARDEVIAGGKCVVELQPVLL